MIVLADTRTREANCCCVIPESVRCSFSFVFMVATFPILKFASYEVYFILAYTILFVNQKMHALQNNAIDFSLDLTAALLYTKSGDIRTAARERPKKEKEWWQV